MKNKIFQFTVAVIVMSIFPISCDDINRVSTLPDDNGGNLGPDSTDSGTASIWNTPRPNAEAEKMALWLSGETAAPDTLYARIEEGLKKLRAQYGDLYPVNDEFEFPAQVSRITFSAFKQLYEMIRDGEYTGWDRLNERYEIDSVVLRPPKYGFYGDIYFKGRKNSYRLAAEYRRRGEFGGFSAVNILWYDNILPWIENGKLAFLVRESRPNSPSDFGILYYFMENADSFQFAGYLDKGNFDTPLGMPGWEDRYYKPINRYLHYPAFIDSLVNGL